MSTTQVPQVKAYMAELERALRDLPRDRRTEVTRDIRAHIDGALAGSDASPALVATVLDSLGTPQEIADASYAEMPPARRQLAGRDIAAVVLLLVGGLIVPFVGWFVGVILLWTSDTWRVRDKWIGTVLVPGGLFTPLVGAGLAAFVPVGSACQPATTTVVGVVSASAMSSGCESSGTSVAGIVVGILLVLAFIAPLFSTFWLLRTARRVP